MNTPLRLAAVAALPLILGACATHSSGGYSRESNYAMQGLLDETFDGPGERLAATPSAARTMRLTPPPKTDTLAIGKPNCKSTASTVNGKCKKVLKSAAGAVKKAAIKTKPQNTGLLSRAKQVVLSWLKRKP